MLALAFMNGDINCELYPPITASDLAAHEIKRQENNLIKKKNGQNRLPPD